MAACRRFVEIHVATDLAECERRDPKGLYRKARAGEITQFTGLDDPYEPPDAAEIVIDTTTESATAAADRILAWLRQPRAAAKARQSMTHLDALEHRSVHILREAYANFRQLCMLWSIGKDSTVLLWLARKAFFGHVPFPLVHIDTSYKIPEMIAYRDRLVAEWGLNLVYGQHHEALAAGRTFPHGAVDRLTCCGLLKTEALTRTLSGDGPRFRFNHASGAYERDPDTEAYTGVIVGARADEEGSRSKERYFSPRSTRNQWDVGEQPPEFWQQYKTEFAPGTHVRIHPLLDWTELNIWRIHRARVDPGRVALLRSGAGHALPLARLRAVHGTHRVDRAHGRRDRPRARDRRARAHGRALGPRAGCRRRRRPRVAASRRLHVSR